VNLLPEADTARKTARSMNYWKDIIGYPPNDGDIVTVRRIPTDTPAFTAQWKPAILDGVLLCGPENWVLPWTHVWAWRSLVTPLDWPIRGPAANPWHDVYLDPPADNQHVWLRRELSQRSGITTTAATSSPVPPSGSTGGPLGGGRFTARPPRTATGAWCSQAGKTRLLTIRSLWTSLMAFENERCAA